MDESVAHYVNGLQQKHCLISVIDCDKFLPDDIDLFAAIQSSHKPEFDITDAVCFVITKDYHDSSPAGVMLRSLQKILNKVDISNFFVHVVTTNPDVVADYQWVLENVSTDKVPINLHVVPGHYRKTYEHDVNEFYALNLNDKAVNLSQLQSHHRSLLFDSKTFCMKPWTTLTVLNNNRALPCCAYRESLGDCGKKSLQEIYNDKPMQDLRRAMLSGQPIQACRRCYDEETHLLSKTSQRQESLRDYADLIYRVDQTQLDFDMLQLDVVFDNLCNMACRTCGPRSSTSWHGPAVHFGIKSKNSKAYTRTGNDSLDMSKQIVDMLPSLRQLNISGGEPFMQDAVYDLLCEIKKRGRLDLEITIITNLSRKRMVSDAYLDLLRSFPQLTIRASIDAEGIKHEYLRPRADWSQIIDLRKKLLRELPDLHFVIQPVVNIVNALHIPDLHQSWVDQGFVQAGNCRVQLLAEEDSYLNVFSAPEKLRTAIIDRYTSHLEWLKVADLTGRSAVSYEAVLRGLKHVVKRFDPDLFWTEIDKLDDYHAVRFADHFPEIIDLLR